MEEEFLVPWRELMQKHEWRKAKTFFESHVSNDPTLMCISPIGDGLYRTVAVKECDWDLILVPLIQAYRDDDVQIMELLELIMFHFNAIIKVSMRCVQYAMYTGNSNIVRMLAFHHSVIPEFLPELAKEMILHGNKDFTELLFTLNDFLLHNIDGDGQTILHLCMSLGDEISKTKRDLIISRYWHWRNIADKFGRTPLLIYALCDNPDFSEITRLNEISPNAADKDGDSVLHCLVYHREFNAALQVLSTKFDAPILVNAKNEKNMRAFDTLTRLHKLELELLIAFVDLGVVITHQNMLEILVRNIPLYYLKTLLYHPNFTPGDIREIAKKATSSYPEAIPLILTRFPSLQQITTLFELLEHGFEMNDNAINFLLNYIPKDVMFNEFVTPIPFHKLLLKTSDTGRELLCTRYLDNYWNYAQQSKHLRDAMAIMSLMDYRAAGFLHLRNANERAGRFLNILSKIPLEIILLIVVKHWAGLEPMHATSKLLEFASYEVLLWLIKEEE
jgi:hypothetical protein